MLSHVFIGVNDFDRAVAFYSPVLERLGLVPRFTEPARPWAGWQTPGVARPLFLIGRPFDGQPAAPGNGAAIGGLKVTTENAWFAARPSGTENVYKVYAESFVSAEHLTQVQEEAKQVVSDALA